MATDQFELQIGAWVAKAGKNVEIVTRRITFDVFERVIIASPVDHGRFKSNWLPAIGSIPTGTLDTVDKEGTATIARMKSTVDTMKVGQVAYMVNNLEYARVLEYGHSKQAPAGMVRITVQNFQQIANRAVAEVPK